MRATAEAITLIRALSGGGEPVTFDGEFYHVSGLDPADASAPRVFTGSVGPKSLAVTGRLADGWVPPMASDWLSQLYRASRPRIDAAAAAAGRDPAQVARSQGDRSIESGDGASITPTSCDQPSNYILQPLAREADGLQTAREHALTCAAVPSATVTTSPPRTPPPAAAPVSSPTITSSTSTASLSRPRPPRPSCADGSSQYPCSDEGTIHSVVNGPEDSF